MSERKPTLNDLAPYPDFLSQVSAEGIARYNATVALEEHHLRMKLDGLVDGHAWKRALHNARTGWAVALLLRALIKHAGQDVADTVACDLWKDWDDSQDFATQLTGWVSEAGVDPAVLVEMAQDSYEQVQKLKTLRVTRHGEHALSPELIEAAETYHDAAEQILAASAPRTLPDFITLDPNKGSCGETPGAHWHCTPHRHSGTWVGQAGNAAAARMEALAHLDKMHPGWNQPTTPS